MEAKPVVDEGVTESLRRLQSLLDDGVITESEFEEKKRQLLDQPATRAAPPGETPPPPKKIKAAPAAPAAPPAAPPAIQPPGGSNEPSLPLGYYALLPGSATTGSVIGYLVLSVWKSSGGFFGLMTLTSGEWEVEDYDGDLTTLLPVISWVGTSTLELRWRPVPLLSRGGRVLQWHGELARHPQLRQSGRDLGARELRLRV